MKNIKMIRVVVVVLGCLLVVSGARAGVPAVVNFQGRLLDTVEGGVVDGVVPMTFQLYDADTGGNLLWEENHDAVQVVAGIYAVQIGAGTPAPANTMNFAAVLEQYTELWLQVVVDGTVMEPRQLLSSVPFAVRAGSADVAFGLSPWMCAEGQILKKSASGWQCASPGAQCYQGDFLSCYTGPAGTMGAGPCVAGRRTCGADGFFGDCVGEVTPVTETCNGTDDDCNGLVDDAPGSPLWYEDADGDGYGDPSMSRHGCSRPTGYVADATDCDPGDSAVYPGAFERCNGKDDNCDGAVDQDLAANQGCLVPPACTADEQALLQSPCGSDPACVQSGVSASCLDAYVALGQCALQACSANANPECIQASCPDQYDAIFVARTPECAFGETRPCGSDVGACVPGVEACVDGLWSGVCEGAVGPVEEVCGDGLDNDCNGVVDDPLPWYADGDGDGFGDDSMMVSTCAAPVGYLREAGDCNDADPDINPLADDLCDGIDNNCDGQVDEDFPEVGQACTEGAGVCAAAGVMTCSPDGWDLLCSAVAGTPGQETCNGLDDDCDGVVDNNLVDAGAACGVGVCAGGVMECQAATLVCSTNSLAGDEVCNGLDDDCDGMVDEKAVDATSWYRDNDGDGYGDVGQSLTACTQPAGYEPLFGDCDDQDAKIAPGARELCDGRDNDCDGTVDEDFPGLGAPCTTGVGSCQASGVYVCGGGGVVCDAVPSAPTAEICDGIDNDCDGQTDETFPNLGVPCGVGVCSGGVFVCTADTLQESCSTMPGGVNDLSSPEICDNRDNDCDGLVDEDATDAPTWYLDLDGDGFGDDTQTIVICASQAHDGYVSQGGDCNDSDSKVAPTLPEVCGDGIDNDCDGTVDNGCLPL